MVANESFVSHRSPAQLVDFGPGRLPGTVLPADGETQGEHHDPRGLVVSILLCLGCWAILGFYFFT